MCGLAGLLGQEVITPDLEAFEELFTMTTFRGYDSYGLFSYTPFGQNKNHPYKIKKELGKAATFMMEQMDLKRHNRFINTIYSEVIFGHARWATKGAVTKNNAHPFDSGRYIGMHNGTLTDKRFQSKDKTDSQMMFELIEKEGIIPVLSSLSYRDAYAVAIFDKSDKTVTLARNTQRPLYVGICKQRGTMFFASELEMLRLISERRREPMYDKIEMDFFHLNPYVEYKINLRKIKGGNNSPWTTIEYGAPKIKTPVITEIDDDLLKKYSIRKEHKSCDLSGITDFFDGDEQCSSCGDTLYGTKLQRASPFTPAGSSQTLFTCEECQKMLKNEIKAGPKIAV